MPDPDNGRQENCSRLTVIVVIGYCMGDNSHIHAGGAFARQELLPRLLLTATSAFTYSFVSSTFKSGMNLTTFPSFLACFLSLSLATSYDRREEDILLE